MNSDTSAGNSLREMELEVEAQGREWMRQRLQEQLQARVEKDGAIFPPERTQSAPSKKTDAIAHQFRHGGAEGVAR